MVLRMNAENNKIEEIAARIEGIFQGGIFLEGALLDFIDSTFCNPSLEQLREALSDESGDDKDVLLELLFFPDENIQKSLEPLLETHDFSAEDVSALQAKLLMRKIETRVVFPDGRGFIELELPPNGLSAFLARLHLDRRIEERLGSALQRHLSESERIAVRVQIRNNPKPLEPNKIVFLCDLVANMAGDESLQAVVGAVLALFGEIEDQKDLYAALMAKKRFHFGSLKKMDRIEEQLSRNNVETLMLRGEAIACVDRNEALNTIVLIDRASLAVFGTTEPLPLENETAEQLEIQPGGTYPV